MNGERRTIRLGSKVDDRTARRFADHVADLAAEYELGSARSVRLVTWLADLPEITYNKIVRTGLAKKRVKAETITLSQLWDRFLGAKSVKPATHAIHKRVRKSMEAHFKAACPIEDIRREQAERWCKQLTEDGLAGPTRSKLIQIAKQLFARAEDWELLAKNPFEGIRPGPQTNAKRAAYISMSDLEKIIDACPSHDWKCIFGLARLSGLRCPSELTSLRWDDIDFKAGRMTITSPKTEHHAEGAVRIVPIVPRLHDLLMDAFTAAEDGAVHVVPHLRHADTNLRTHAHRILTRAGIVPPPTLFVNMRSSCATDWAQQHGGHIAAKWCGHSPLIALKHYAQVRPEDFERATGRKSEKVALPVAQNRAEMTGNDRKVPASDAQITEPETPDFPGDSDDFRSVPELAHSGAGGNQWAQQAQNFCGFPREIRVLCLRTAQRTAHLQSITA